MDVGDEAVAESRAVGFQIVLVVSSKWSARASAACAEKFSRDDLAEDMLESLKQITTV